MCEELGVLEEGDLVYLFLPLAHAYALLIQLLAIDLGGAIAYFGGDPKQIVPELMEVHPDYLPSVPRIFEKIYTLVTSNGDPEQIKGAVGVGLKVRALQAAGQEVPAELQAHYDKADEALFKNVRGAFGGKLKQANTGAAPIAKEILEFFYACGVPVMEGYGMTETATVATTPDGRRPPARLGRQAAARLRDPHRRRRRGPDQGPEHLRRLLQERRRELRHDRRRLAAHRRPRLARRRRLPLRSPAARRTSSSPRAARTSRRPTSRTTSSSRAGSRRRSCTATAARTRSR